MRTLLDAARARALIALFIAGLLTAACNINPIPTPGGDAAGGGVGGDDAPVFPGADAGGGMDVVAAEDTATAPDVPTPSDVVGDVPTDDVADIPDVVGDVPDVAPVDVEPADVDTSHPGYPRLDPVEAECVPSSWWAGALQVRLRWTTDEPADCTIRGSLGDGDFHELGYVEEQSDVDHEYSQNLMMYDYWGAPPVAGDRARWEITCNVATGFRMPATATATLVLDETDANCIWPFVRACGDDSFLMCRAGITGPCPLDGYDYAVTNSCWHCVHPDTCTCDDGSEPVCPRAQPQCPDYAPLAIQDGCWACVDPMTCEPVDL